jgi:hypothetical protein
MAAPATNVLALAMICPPLYAQGQAAYQGWLDMADGQCAPSDGTDGWAGQRTIAVACLAAHQWQRMTNGVGGLTPTAAEATGIVSSEGATNPQTQRGLTRSYAVPSSASPEEAELLTTRYGQMFVSLRRRTPAFGARTATVSAASPYPRRTAR